MSFLLCVYLLFQVVSAAVIHVPRQVPEPVTELQEPLPDDVYLPSYLFGSRGNEPLIWVKPETIEKLQPQLRKDARRELIRWGPFEIPGKPGVNETRDPQVDGRSMDPLGYVINRLLKGGLCKNCTVLAGKTDIAFKDGKRADISNGIYLHHILVPNASKVSPEFVSFCAGDVDFPAPNPLGNTFLGTGNDEAPVFYTTPDAKLQSGYFIKDDIMALQADVVNYSSHNQSIYVTFDYEYLPGKLGNDATSILLSVTGCSTAPGFHFADQEPVGNLTSEKFLIFEEGEIIAAKGHLHDGGERMELFHNDKLVCISNATYGGQGGTMRMNGTQWQTISKMTECNEPVKIKKGDKLVMNAVYDAKKHPLRVSDGEKMESMGMFTLTFVPNGA